jgi:hypothetical protein
MTRMRLSPERKSNYRTSKLKKMTVSAKQVPEIIFSKDLKEAIAKKK